MNNVRMKDGSLFNLATRYFLDYFGLQSWEVYIESQLKDGVRGSCYWNLTSRTATICWSQHWISRDDLSKEELCKVAFHECCELFLASLHDCMKESRGEDFAQAQVHIPIRFLENKLYPIAYKEFCIEHGITTNE